MAITSIKTGSSFTNLTKYNDFLAGNAAFDPSTYQSISTVTVGSGGSASIDFTSISSTYTHLQIRGIARTANAGTGASLIFVRANSDTASNYSTHYLGGDGATAYAGAAINQTNMWNGVAVDNGYPANTFSNFVLDVLDYANTNKYKTFRVLSGGDGNGVGEIYLFSGNWRSTSAITSLTLYAHTNFLQYSQYALYGIKGA
jgi:hypothetical protein